MLAKQTPLAPHEVAWVVGAGGDLMGQVPDFKGLLPTLPIKDAPDSGLSNRKFYGEFGNTCTRVSGVAYFLGDLWINLSVWILDAFKPSLKDFRELFSFSVSVFGNHISCIFCRCAKKKMFGFNAGWVVTRMTNEQAVRNFSVSKLIRKPMRPNLSLKERYPAISFFVFRTTPLNAFSALSGIFKKNLFKNFHMMALKSATGWRQ
jgi:hypothetical protein